MQIEVYADVVCPWCYVGERRLELALAQRPDVTIERVWRPFQLRPEMPQGGLPWREFAQEKFGGWQRAQAAFAQVTQAGAADGLEFNFDRVASAPNTVDAHRLILWGRERGQEWETASALFAAYFAGGCNLNNRDELVTLMASLGFEGGEVRDYLASEANVAEVKASQQQAGQLGVQSVPFYVLDGRYAVSGAQPVEVFVRALDTASGKMEVSKR